MIYLVTNLINGDRYIGKTSKTLEERWYYHCKTAEYGSDTYFHKAIRKYGSENFKVEFLCDGLDDEEIKAISIHQPEYNMTSGGGGGDTSNSPNYIAAMRNRNYNGPNNPNYGKVGVLNPKFGKSYGKKPLISESKKKRLISSEGIEFKGFQQMFEYYGVKSYYSLKKIGITWSELKND